MSIELVLLGEILSLSRDPEISLEEFGEKVATSPQLAAEVVRVSNSALYGMEGKINRLERAVLILGMRAVADIASSVLVAKRMRGVNVGSLSGDELWMHSLQIGVCAQLTARCLSLPMESEAYLAGLLHDLGVIEMYQSHGEPYGELVTQSHQQQHALLDDERKKFDDTHASRIGSCAQEWGFPDLLRDAIAHHDDPMAAPEAARTLATLIRTAHAIVPPDNKHWTDVPVEAEHEVFFEALGLTPEDVEDIQLLYEERIKEVATLFR